MSMCTSLLEDLRVFKRVEQKIRSTLVSGREDMVSPTVVTRSFIDSFEKMVPATSLVRYVCCISCMVCCHLLLALTFHSYCVCDICFHNACCSQDSGISSGEREGSPNGHRQNECPFIEPADGWSVEYNHKNCEVSMCEV